jgi:hypothetical protein
MYYIIYVLLLRRKHMSSNDKAVPITVDPVALSAIDWLNRMVEDLRRAGETIVNLEKLADGLGSGNRSLMLATELRRVAERNRASIKALHDALKSTAEAKQLPQQAKGEAGLTVVGGSDAKTGS